MPLSHKTPVCTVVSKHWFEVIADWPTATNAARKCSDWITYPCFQGTCCGKPRSTGGDNGDEFDNGDNGDKDINGDSPPAVDSCPETGLYTEQRDANLALKFTSNVFFDDTYRPAADWLDWNSYQRRLNLLFVRHIINIILHLLHYSIES